MIIILEGAAGSGKTTLATALSLRTSYPIYRAFRRDGDRHAPGQQDRDRLASLNVPVNTWMEDLFAADVFANVSANVILDRSMPSALAYEEMGKGTGLDGYQRGVALDLWTEKIRRSPRGALLVHLEADVPTMAERSGRFSPEFSFQESTCIRKYVQLSGLMGLEFKTDAQDLTETIRAILKRI